MTDKILKEAFDKLTQIEESAFGYGDDCGAAVASGQRQPKSSVPDRVPGSEWDRVMSNLEKPAKKKRNKKKRVSEESDGFNDDVADGIEEFTDIQDELFEIIERLDSAIRAYAPNQHRYWQAYGLAHLKVIAGSDEYASSDESISKLIQNLHDELENDRDQYGDRPEQ